MSRQCDEQMNRVHQDLAIQRYGNTDRFCKIDNVRVISSTERTLTFRAVNTSRVQKDYTIDWDDDFVYAPCPSTLPSDAVASATKIPLGAPPTTGSGSLYVDYDWALQPANSDLARSVPKWPRSFSADAERTASFHKGVDVWVARVIVVGTELTTGNFYEGEVDLADARYAKAGQTIKVDSETKSLMLTADGCANFNVYFDAFAHLSRATEILQAGSERFANSQIADAFRIIAACIDNLHTPSPDCTPDQKLAMLRKIAPSFAPRSYTSGA